jgi:hypothetical protein
MWIVPNVSGNKKNFRKTQVNVLIVSGTYICANDVTKMHQYLRLCFCGVIHYKNNLLKIRSKCMYHTTRTKVYL